MEIKYRARESFQLDSGSRNDTYKIRIILPLYDVSLAFHKAREQVRERAYTPEENVLRHFELTLTASKLIQTEKIGNFLQEKHDFERSWLEPHWIFDFECEMESEYP